MVARYERILNLVAALLVSREPIPLAEIRQQVCGYDEGSAAAVRKRFERDRKSLADMGFVLRIVSPLGGRPGGYVLDRSCLFLRPIELAPEESRVLALLGRHCPAQSGSALAANLQAALLKLQTGSRDLDGAPALPRRDGRGGRDPAVHDLLSRAVIEGRPVSFEYRSGGGPADEATTRVVEPYGLGFWQGQWYLVGWCRRREGVRTFRLDRVQGRPEALDGKVVVPPGFRLEEHLVRHGWEVGDSSPGEACVAFDAATFWMAAREAAPADQAPDADGGGRVRIRYAEPDLLLGWLHGFRSHARIEGPPELLRRSRELLAEVARRHGGAPATVPPAPRPAAETATPPKGRTDTSRLSRILTLIPFLARHPGIHVEEVSRLSGVPPAEVVEDLREVLMCGVPPYLPDDYIGVYLENGRITLRWADHFRPLALTLTEALALRLAIHRVLGDAPDALAGRLRTKIEEVLPPGVARHMEALAERIQVAAGGTPEVMGPLLEALASSRKVRAEYWSLSTGELTDRVLHPYTLAERAGAFYLLAHCELRRDVRAFHTGRLRSVELLADRFDPPAELSEDALPDPADAAPGEVARILFDPPAARRIADTFEPGDWRALPDGRALATLRLVSPRWLVAWLFTFGSAFEVLEPASLRRELAGVVEGL